jgi:hypothetical protein
VSLVICCDGTWNTPEVTENGVPSQTHTYAVVEEAAELLPV